MNIKLPIARFAVFLLLPILSCDSENDAGMVYAVNGYAQKGPFAVGSNVTISELSSNLIPTGQVYFSTIQDNSGYFELPGVTLNSPFIQIKVEGKYFGEATGGVQNDEMTLYSIADVREGQSINVNIITHLIKRRIEKLVKDSGLSFTEAKDQAFDEFLETFKWNDLDVDDADQLSVTENNLGGSILLTTSIIFDNIADPVARLSTITNFQTDFIDGQLDDESTQSMLITSATSLNVSSIKSNLQFYFGQGHFADFTESLSQFVEETEFVNFLDLFYPTTFNNKENLIRKTDSIVDTSTTYYVSVTIPAGVGSDVLLALVSRTDSSSNRFITPEQFWDQSYAVDGVQCDETPGNNTCFESYAILHRVNMSENINIQIPITFSGTGTMTLYYQAFVNGVSSANERQFTW